MNITIDKEKKTITLHEEVTMSDLVDYICDANIEGWSSYKLIFPPKEIQYIPIYPASPIPMYPYPAYPYPVYPQPGPYNPPWIVTCSVNHTLQNSVIL